MLQCKWTCLHITTNAQANAMIAHVQQIAPQVGGFDTETSGLHIIKDKPFLFQFGYLDLSKMEGFSYLVDIEKQPQLAHQVIRTWHQLASTFKVYMAHNVKFDLHMTDNIGESYRVENLSDTQFYIRYAHDAVQEQYGGPPLGLKEYSARYISHTARDHDKLIQAEQGQLAKDYNLKLKIMLRPFKPPEESGHKSYTIKALDEIFTDATFSPDELVPEIKTVYDEWLRDVVPPQVSWAVNGLVEPDNIPYTMLDRKNMYKYALQDIVLMLETWLVTNATVIARGNEAAIELENSNILPLLEMESVGFDVDVDYLLTAKEDIRVYIKQRRATLHELAGEPVGIGQHALIKTLLNDRFGLSVTATGAEELDLILEGDLDPNARGFIEAVQELRTLEKWYKTYVLRFLNNLKKTNKIYTTIHQVGTVSGRVTSDFQQFPKSAIKRADGTELFHPRKMVLAQDDEFEGIVFLDYSQIELRLQAQYTILVGHPDLNLCRAYMPYQCEYLDGTPFDYENPEHLKNWREPWYRIEDGVEWTPTDLHSATTIAATGLTPDDPAFKGLRTSIGKRTNFAKQYGASRKRIRAMFPHATEAEVDRINDSYYFTFPGVKEYHNYCYRAAQEFGFVKNLYGIRYYGTSGHKLINILIQGSAAFLLKAKIRELYNYTKEHGIKSKFQMNIHDELSWKKHPDESEVFFAFQKIMEDWPGLNVPIVAEMEATKTNWSEKKGVHTINELQDYFGH